MIRYLLVVLLFISSIAKSYGQVITENLVTLYGHVIDSIEGKPIPSATVSIYQVKKGNILKYGFTSNNGFFNLPILSLDSVFQLRISSIGYKNIEMNVSRSILQKKIKIGDIRMKSSVTLIDEVLVKRPPMMMNRDTLEINAEAFDLQPNAVVEDLLIKVPGIVIWGDGAITVNGKRVVNVLVEGKPFFGTNPVVATRNLPSGAIDKIRVYDSPQNAPHQEEQLEIDIRLKKGKKNGVFGKVSASEGTADHREATFLLNYFDSKNQITGFVNANNTNKLVSNISEFQAANVYKPGGENLDSNTPLSGQIGLNNFFIAGTKFERTWSKNLNTNIEAIYNDRKSRTRRDVQEIRLFEEGDKQYITEDQQDHKQEEKQQYLMSTRYKNKKWDFTLNSNFQQMKSSHDQLYSRQVRDEEGQMLSNLDKDIHINEQTSKGRLGFDLKRNNSYFRKYEMSYKLDTENRSNEQQENFIFTNHTPIDRLKKNDQGSSRHEILININMDNLLENTLIRSLGLTVDMHNKLIFHQRRESQIDLFLDSSANTYSVRNPAISYADRLKETLWKPELAISKSFIKNTGKGQNSLLLSAASAIESNIRKNASDHELRRLNQHFLSMLPSASIRYGVNRQLSNKSLSFDYKTLVNQPAIYQLIALIDTTQRDFNRIGNRNLTPEEQHLLSLEYTERHSVKNRSQSLRFTYKLLRNELTDSSVYSPDGAWLSQTVNSDGLPKFQVDYNYKIGKKLGGRPLNISLITQLNGGQHYYYNNSIRYKNRNTNSQLQTYLHYGLSDHLKLGLIGSLNNNWNSSAKNEGHAGSYRLGFDVILNWPRRTTMINRFETKSFYTKGLPSNQQNIWNVDVYYRLLKKEQLEIKFTAYDILKNNSTIQSFVRDNIVRQVRVNNMQQFFMVGLSYYPRMF